MNLIKNFRLLVQYPLDQAIGPAANVAGFFHKWWRMALCVTSLQGTPLSLFERYSAHQYIAQGRTENGERSKNHPQVSLWQRRTSPLAKLFVKTSSLHISVNRLVWLYLCLCKWKKFWVKTDSNYVHFIAHY